MQKLWYQEQLRILQTVLREKDLEGYDAGRVIRYMKEAGANCLVVNAGGVIDFFPNPLEMGRPTRYLAGQDILKELIQKCHENGLRVVTRVDFRGVEKERYERKPDWFGQNEDGSPLMGWNGRIHRPCYSSTYGGSHAQQLTEYLLGTYGMDGIWENCVIFGYGPCYCKKCREGYLAFSGEEIPSGVEYEAEEFKPYREWKAGLARGHMDQMRQAVKKFGEDKAYVSEVFGMYHASTALTSGIDLYDVVDRFDFLVSPMFLDGSAQPERIYEDYSSIASGVRFLKALAPGKVSVALTGGNGTKWRYVMAPRQESRIWMWEAVGAGGNLWNNYFNGICPDAAVDRRNAFVEQDAFRFLEENEAFLKNQQPDGEIGVFYSRATRDRFGKDSLAEDGYGCFLRGVDRVLTDCHLPYRFLPDLHFTWENLKGVRVLILANAACLAEEQMELVRRFVREGGGLVASYQTSLYDGDGRRRPDFGLGDVFGCSFTGHVRDTHYDCYQMVRAEHPVLCGLEIGSTEMIMNEEKTLLCVQTGKEHTALCTYVPEIPNQPPEFAWIPEETTDYPTILAGSYGAGRVVYFAGQVERACYTNGHEDFILPYRNAVEWAAGGSLSFKADAPEGVQIALTADPDMPGRKVVSFVNTTSGPNRPIRSVQPVFGIEARIRGGKLNEAKVLWEESEAGISVESGEAGQGTVIRIARLHEFAAVYLDIELT